MQSLLSLLESGKAKDTATALQGLEAILETSDHSKLLQIGIIQGISNALLNEKESFIQKKTNKSAKLDHLRRLENVLMLIVIEFGRLVPKKIINVLLDHVFDMHSPAVFEGLILSDGRLLNHLFSFPEARNYLTVNQFIDLIGFCDLALKGDDENTRSVSSGVLYEYSKLMQLLVICFPRDWSAHQGKHAIWTLECIIEFFEVSDVESSAHPLLLATANHLFFEWGLNAPKLSSNLAKKLSITSLKFIQSKNGVRGPLVSLLRLYLDLLEFLKVVERQEYHSLSLLLIWDALQYDFSGRFRNSVYLIPDMDGFVSKIPLSGHSDVINIKLSSNSWESVAFCDLFANVTCSILDYQRIEEDHAISCTAGDRCANRIFHIQPLLIFHSALKKLLPDNYLVCQIIFFMFLKYHEKIPEKHQKIILGMLISSNKQNINSEPVSTWTIIAISQIVSIIKDELVNWDAISGIVATMEVSDKAIAMAKVLAEKRQDILCHTLGSKIWDWGFSQISEQSLSLIETLVKSKYPYLDSKRCMHWMSKVLTNPFESFNAFIKSIRIIWTLCQLDTSRMTEAQLDFEDTSFISIPFQLERSLDVYILEYRHYQFFTWIDFCINGIKPKMENKILDLKLIDSQDIISCILGGINILVQIQDINMEWQQRCLYFLLISQFILNYGINLHILSKSNIENLIGNPLSSLLKKFQDYLLVTKSVVSLNYHLLSSVEELRARLKFSMGFNTLKLAQSYSKFMEVYSSCCHKCNSGTASLHKRKRSNERLQDSDSDKSPIKCAGNIKKKTLNSVSPTHILFSNGAFNTELESEEQLVLRRLHCLIGVRFFRSGCSVPVSKLELEIIANFLRDEQFHSNESVVIFYMEFSRWISISAEALTSQNIQECLTIMSYVLNLSFLSKNQWILCSSLTIMYHILPFINQTSLELLEQFKKLIAAFTLLLRGKSSLRSSDDICVQWKVLLRYIEVYLRCLDLKREKLVFNDSNILESSALLYLNAWNHHHFEMRILAPLRLSLVKENDLSNQVESIDQLSDSNNIMLFISTAWVYRCVGTFSSRMRLSAMIKLLELVVSEFKTYFISNLLDDISHHLGFISGDAFLLALIDQRLFFQWKQDIEKMPYILFGFSTLSDFLLHTLEESLPKIIYDSKWDLLSNILSNVSSQSLVFRQHLSRILVELALDYKSVDQLANDTRWNYAFREAGATDPIVDSFNLFKSFVSLMDDEKNIMGWNETFSNLWAEFGNKVRSEGCQLKRPLLTRSLSLRKVSKLLSFVFGSEERIPNSYLSPGDFLLLLEWFDRTIEFQKFEYERSRLLKNGYVALINLNLANITYPLIFHMIIRTITECMRYSENVESMSILLIYVFSYVRLKNSKLVTESGMQLMDLMNDILHSYDGNQSVQNLVLQARERIQGQISEIGGSVKSLSRYQLNCDSNHNIEFGLSDIFDFSQPQEFKYFMVDHLAAVINFQSSITLLLSNSHLSQLIITRLLQIIQKDKVPQKSIVKIGYIIGKLIPFSHKNVSHHPLSASNLGVLEIVIFEGLNDALYVCDRNVREIASQTLACILREDLFYSFAEKHLSSKTFESIRILKDRMGAKKIRPPIPRKTYKSISHSPLWICENHEEWISDFSNGILLWKAQSGIFSFLPATLEAYKPMAESLFPFIVFEHLNDLNFKELFETQVNHILSMSDTFHRPNLRSIIRTIDFIRRQDHPESRSPFENYKRWINIDFLILSKSASISDMGYHALLFAEIALIDDPANMNLYLEILAEIYKKIDDLDGFVGILMLMNSSQISEVLINEKIKCHKAWNRLTQSKLPNLTIHQKADTANIDLALTLGSKGDLGPFGQSVFCDQSPSNISWESKWRNNVWDNQRNISVLDLDIASSSRDGVIYRCLSALNSGSLAEYRNTIHESFSSVMNKLKIPSTVYGSNELLLSLTFLSDFQDMSLLYNNQVKIDDLLISWNRSSDLLLSNYDFDLYESNMACKTQLLTSYNIFTKNRHISYLCDQILKYSKICRKNGFLEGSLASINQYKSLEILDQDQISLFGIKGLKAVLERLKILWLQDEKLLAIKFLKDIIQLVQGQTDSKFEIAEDIGRCYGLVGQWIAEAKSESSIDVIKLYFTPAINGASILAKNHHKLAHYADEQHNEMVREYESLGTLHEQLAKHKKDQLTAVENNYSKLGESDKLKLDRARKQMQLEVEMDRSELRRLEDLRNEFLLISIRNYLLTLSSEDTKWNMSVFRLVTLWFSNCDNPDINQLMSTKISGIRSSKFLVILYQLSARLLTISHTEDEFCRILTKLLCKMSTDHPYHTLHHILALVNTEKIKKNGNRASQLLGMLKKPLSRLIQEFDIIMKGYMSLSAIPYNPKDKDRSIPTTNYLLRISDSKLSIPPFTMDLEVSPTCQYDSVPSITRFDSSYFVPGGINAPKVITCIASDGKKYRQLVKGNGIFGIFILDDLRQDAVLIKIFEILNVLLVKQPKARERNLNIRTYKVVPLSPKAGVVQWVENTYAVLNNFTRDTFSNILIPAHKKYNINDWKPEKCREVMSKEQNRRTSIIESKLEVYQQICSHFSPAFKYLFLENYQDPQTWHEKRNAFTRSIATSSIAGWISGLGDRHINNILFDKVSAEAIHIDLGIAFDQGKLLSTPEQVPFRLTRDIVDVMGVTGVEGVFRIACEETLRVLRAENKIILMILEVFRHDPLYRWSASERRQEKIMAEEKGSVSIEERARGNKEAARALLGYIVMVTDYRVQKKLLANSSVECQVNELIQLARDPKNLSRMFAGWQGMLNIN